MYNNIYKKQYFITKKKKILKNLLNRDYFLSTPLSFEAFNGLGIFSVRETSHYNEFPVDVDPYPDFEFRLTIVLQDMFVNHYVMYPIKSEQVKCCSLHSTPDWCMPTLDSSWTIVLKWESV